MFEFLQRVFIGHNHKWETIETAELYESDDSSRRCGLIYYCRCTICGKMKRFVCA
jgi:hypothetical protein